MEAIMGLRVRFYPVPNSSQRPLSAPSARGSVGLASSKRLALQTAQHLCWKAVAHRMIRCKEVSTLCTGVCPKSSIFRVNKIRHRSAAELFFPSSVVKQAFRGGVRCELAGSATPDALDTSWNGGVVSSSGPTILQRFRAFCFYMVTYIVAAPLFVIMLFIHPLVLLLDKQKRKAQHLINKIWATLTIVPFYKTEFEGLENLPGPDEPAVYVSNHQSFLDIYTLFLLGRPFKFISKTSNFLIPIIGWSMWLTGHVPLRRMDTKSQLECLRQCLMLLKQGVSVFFFPEGTRTKDGKMANFKKGAFTIAAKAKVPVVPVSLIGTGKLMPNGMEGTLRPGSVKVIIHPPIHGTSPEELCKQARTMISESLSKHGLEVR